jgi:hypothetical protein
VTAPPNRYGSSCAAEAAQDGHELVLRSRTPAQTLYKFSLTNASNSSAQTTRTISRDGLQISKTMPAGAYDMFLRLPDPSPQLADRADYAIQLSNTGTWDASSGMNRLARTVTVS